MTKLEAVNDMLSRVGFTPVAALDTGNSSLQATAERKIDQEAARIQRMGWYFNTFNDVEATPDGSNNIVLTDITADTIYHIDTYGQSAHINVVVREDKLYNLDTNTETFDDPIRVTYTKEMTWLEIPEAFQQWIYSEAAILFVRDYARNINRNDRREILQELYTERDRDKSDAMREENLQRDTNLLNTPQARRLKGNRRRYYGGNNY